MPLHEADHYADAIISPDVLRSYVYCRYKAYLKLSSEVGAQCAYEAALAELRAEAKQRAFGKLEAAGSPILTSVELTHATLCVGHSAIIDGELTVDGINVRVDGVRKVAGRSQLGDFHYEPLLFHEGPGAREPAPSCVPMSIGPHRSIACEALLEHRAIFENVTEPGGP